MFLFTGGLSQVHLVKRKNRLSEFRLIKRHGQEFSIYGDSYQAFSTVREYNRIFAEVCFWVAGGVAEKVFCNLRGLPKETMVDDTDVLRAFAKYDWLFPFKETKNGFPVCPVLDNMIGSAADLVEALFRSSALFAVQNVTGFLIDNGATPENVGKDPGLRQKLLKILNNSVQDLASKRSYL
ncbi:MAG TPA: hypothetical protein DHV48_12935 [Prolixibacteraceae bacterium]|nr:hypothetical protein [Prolixibacteraceae bacterium]